MSTSSHPFTGGGNSSGSPTTLAAREPSHVSYMRHHNIPLLTESLLMATVPVQHPYPMEAVSQCLLVNAPTTHEVERMVEGVLSWAAAKTQQTHNDGDTTTTSSTLGTVRLGGSSMHRAVPTSDASEIKSSTSSSASASAWRGERQREWTSRLASLTFDVFAFDPQGPELIAFVWFMFDDLGCLHSLGLDHAEHLPLFIRWVLIVRANYHPNNPFHNFRHAFNVLQTLYTFLKNATELQLHRRNTNENASTADGEPKMRLVFRDIEVLAMMMSALCHDLQHPGVNNSFLCDTNHPLAIRYGGEGPILERHHAAVALSVLEYAPLPHLRTAPARSECVLQQHKSRRDTYCDITCALPRRWGLIGLSSSNNNAPSSTIDITNGGSSSPSPPVVIPMGVLADPSHDFPTLRRLILRCILGTEVAAHAKQIADLKSRCIEPLLLSSSSSQVQRNNDPPVTTVVTTDRSNLLSSFATSSSSDRAGVTSSLQTLLMNDSEARMTLMVALVEAADIGNEIRTMDFSRRWAPLVVEEFCQQGDAMLALHWGADCTSDASTTVPNMFRRGVAHPRKDQPGFIRYLCLPLYRELAVIMPSVITDCAARLENNAGVWESNV